MDHLILLQNSRKYVGNHFDNIDIKYIFVYSCMFYTLIQSKCSTNQNVSLATIYFGMEVIALIGFHCNLNRPSVPLVC